MAHRTTHDCASVRASSAILLCIFTPLALPLLVSGAPPATSPTRSTTPAGTVLATTGSIRPPAPIQRIIVPNLTDRLHHVLQLNNISLLLVLPGPQSSSDMKIEWQALTSLERVDFVQSYEDFKAQWHAYKRHHAADSPSHLPNRKEHHRKQQQQQQPHQLAAAAAAAFSAAPSVAQGLVLPWSKNSLHKLRQQQQQQQQQLPPVAVLVRGMNGKVGVQQLSLASAISRHLRHAHTLTLSYSTHTDKGDSIVVLNSEAEPLEAAFLSTSVFKETFTAIYDKQAWGGGGGGSGHGSDLEWTSNLRKQLPQLIQKYNISSLMDSSCGSMFWMPLVLKEVAAVNPGFTFMGTDVVCSLIERHKATFASNTNWQFACVDYANELLPSGYQMVFSRDSLQHLPMHAVWMFLNNVKASGARYLLVGSYIDLKGNTNGDLQKPGFENYRIDVTKPPFSVWQPIDIVDEATPDGKHMLLFDVHNMTWQDPLHGLV